MIIGRPCQTFSLMTYILIMIQTCNLLKVVLVWLAAEPLHVISLHR